MDKLSVCISHAFITKLRHLKLSEFVFYLICNKIKDLQSINKNVGFSILGVNTLICCRPH